MLNLLKLSPDTVQFPWKQRTPVRGLHATLTVAVALVLGHVTGHPGAGSIAAGAAFTVGFGAFHEALASTLLSMGILTAGIASATYAGSMGASRGWVVLLLAVVAAVNYGLLLGISAAGGWIGQQCAVFVVIASAFSRGRHYAVGRASMVMLGGAMQMVMFAFFFLLERKGTAAPSHLRQLRTRSLQLLRALREELHWDGETTSYALRLALAMVVSTAIYRRLHLGNGYWAPMTAILVLKPSWNNTLSRGIARLIGTLAGAGLALLLVHAITLPGLLIAGMVLVFAWLCFALQAVNYAAFSFCLTLYTVFSFRLGGFSEPEAAMSRLINTALGGGLAILIDYVWEWVAPTPAKTTPLADPAPVQ